MPPAACLIWAKQAAVSEPYLLLGGQKALGPVGIRGLGSSSLQDCPSQARSWGGEVLTTLFALV